MRLCRYVDELLYWSGKRMKFDEYLQEELTPKRLPSSWVSNTKFVFQSDDGSLAILDTANDSVTTLVTNHTMVSKFVNRLIGMSPWGRFYGVSFLYLFFIIDGDDRRDYYAHKIN